MNNINNSNNNMNCAYAANSCIAGLHPKCSDGSEVADGAAVYVPYRLPVRAQREGHACNM